MPRKNDPDHEAVRRALVAARHEESVPPDVSARLEETLQHLLMERASDQGEHPVSEPDTLSLPSQIPVPMDAHRRRRRWSIALAVAASVVLIGASGPLWLPSSEPQGDSVTAADSAGSSSADAREGQAADSTAPAQDPALESAPSEARKLAAVTALTAADARDQALLLLQTPRSSLSTPAETPDPDSCSPVHWRHDREIAVTYEGTPARLLARTTGSHTRAVRIVGCSTGTVLDAFTVSLR